MQLNPITNSRFSVNMINKGLTWHHDFVLQEQQDCTLTSPGITLVIHLGRDEEDIVYVDYQYNRSTRTVCKPRTAYIFPGGMIYHRTVREYFTCCDERVAQKRYSLAVFFNFKRARVKEMDVMFHERFPYYTDNYLHRTKNFEQLMNKF